MDETSDRQKLEWLTKLGSPKKLFMVNYGYFEGNWQAPEYRAIPLRRQIDQPSLGNLAKLPPELLHMVFSHMTCADLEALHSCSTGGRMTVLAFPWYQNLLRHAPTMLSILKYTQLDRSFTITQIYEVFTSPLCTVCGHFGGYIFLPSFTRCCITCAETEPRFLPITAYRARLEFGVKDQRIFDSLPHSIHIVGHYSSLAGLSHPRHLYQGLKLYSREMVERFRDPKHRIETVRYSQEHVVGDNSVKAYQRYTTLTPLPCFMPKSASIERGRYCAGCDLRAKDHRACPGMDNFCRFTGRRNQCLIITRQDRLYDSQQILSHLQDCEAAHHLLKWKRLNFQVFTLESVQ